MCEVRDQLKDPDEMVSVCSCGCLARHFTVWDGGDETWCRKHQQEVKRRLVKNLIRKCRYGPCRDSIYC